MSTHYQLLLRHLLRQPTNSLASRDLEPGEDSDRLLPAHRIVPPEDVQCIRELLLPPTKRRKKLPKRDRFVQLNREHSHYICPAKPERRIWRKEPVLNWLRSAGRHKYPGTRSQWDRLQREWEEWAESCSGGWPVESDKFAVVTQRYREIKRIAGFGAHSVVLLSYKIRICNPLIDRYYALKIFREDRERTESDYRR